ncbi:MAG: T9SS type A sorting domain-containing protein [Phaeodactylibacter sp.]|nr:T9SS type A sorting domain-containing protein [Phaeodactylibacter sp.]
MKNIIFTWLLLAGISLLTTAQNIIWERSHKFTVEGHLERAIEVAYDTTNKQVVTYVAYTDSAFFPINSIIKFDDIGDSLWLTEITDSIGPLGNSRDIEVDAEGNIFFIGEAAIIYPNATPPYSDDFNYVAKINSAGDWLWMYHFNRTAKPYTAPHRMKLLPNGLIFVAGEEPNDISGSTDFFAMMIDTAGTLIWYKTYYQPGSRESIWDLVAEPDGSFTLVGAKENYGAGNGVYMLNIAPNGDTLWSNYILKQDWLTSVGATNLPDGGYMIASGGWLTSQSPFIYRLDNQRQVTDSLFESSTQAAGYQYPKGNMDNSAFFTKYDAQLAPDRRSMVKIDGQLNQLWSTPMQLGLGTNMSILDMVHTGDGTGIIAGSTGMPIPGQPSWATDTDMYIAKIDNVGMPYDPLGNICELSPPTANFTIENLGGGGVGFTFKADSLSSAGVVEPSLYYYWNFGDGNTRAGQDSVTHLYTVGDTDTVTVQLIVENFYGCRDTIAYTNIVSNPTVVGLKNEISSRSAISMSVYPNPANDFVTVALSNNRGQGTAELWSMQGRLLRQSVIRGGTGSLSVAGVSAGVYIIKSQTNQGEVMVRKLVVK